MALAEMLRALEEEASLRFEHIRERAAAEAKTLIEGAEERIRPLQDEAMAKARTTLASERARRITRARFDVRKEVSLLQEQLVDEVFAETRENLAETRRHPGYRDVFLALAKEALVGVSGHVTLHVDSRDEELGQLALSEFKAAGEVRADLSTAGGLLVEVGDGRVLIDNTLEARVQKAERFLRPPVNRILFGGSLR